MNSTVHITGEPTEETKAALQRLLRSSDETSNYIQRDAPCKCCCHNDVSALLALNTPDGRAVI